MTGSSTEHRNWRRPTVFYNHTVKWLVYVAIVLFVLWNIWAIRVSPERFLTGIEGTIDLVDRMVPPNFGAEQRSRIWDGTVESVAMAFVATGVGVVISTPIAFLAAENIAPRPVYVIGRAIVSISRAFHSLIIAIIAVIAVGFGPLAGILAIVFATPGFFSKLLAEDIEDISSEQLDAIRATGASPLQVIVFGVIPQIMPRIIGLMIYRWDINIRASTIIGIVGAGGIGSTLMVSFDRYEYDFSLAIILTIVALVLVGELASALARRRYQ
ncbi:phosphonate ABC transporter, permease protein PhnE [Natrialbaceae archaeon A-CW3]